MKEAAKVLDKFPSGLRVAAAPGLRRQEFHIGVAQRLIPPGGKILDIGAGLALFGPALALMGYDVTILDDFRDDTNLTYEAVVLPMFEEMGLTVVQSDAVAEGLSFKDRTFDLITSFDAIEHMHNSPKRLFQDAARCLKRGGWFFLGAPNAVNLRKRITIPLGRGEWSGMGEWYEVETFRGHVREPDVDDFRYIAQSMDLYDVRIIGRNWHGYISPRGWVQKVTPYVDRTLRRWPSLCADIYMLAKK